MQHLDAPWFKTVRRMATITIQFYFLDIIRCITDVDRLFRSQADSISNVHDHIFLALKFITLQTVIRTNNKVLLQ